MIRRPAPRPERTPQRPTVVYITSMGHSGSTLLDLLISSHSQIVSVGEIKMLNRDAQPLPCTCRAATPHECPFWQQVDRELGRAGARQLADLELGSADRATLESDNLALFRAVAAVSGRNIIVDSSKNHQRLQSLLSCSDLDLEIIHLLRSPFGVACSHVRKGRNPISAAAHLARRTLTVHRLLHDLPHLEVRYERLASSPAEVLGQVMRWLGLALEPGQLQFAGRERHNLGGNRMRFNDDSTIAPDLGWRRELSPLQKLLVAGASAPLWLPGAGRVYAGWRRLRRRLRPR